MWVERGKQTGEPVQLGMVVMGVAVIIIWIWNKRDWIYIVTVIGYSWDPKVIKVRAVLKSQNSKIRIKLVCSTIDIVSIPFCCNMPLNRTKDNAIQQIHWLITKIQK